MNCARCASPLSESGFCMSDQCPFYTKRQDDARGWIGHPSRPDVQETKRLLTSNFDTTIPAEVKRLGYELVKFEHTIQDGGYAAIVLAKNERGFATWQSRQHTTGTFGGLFWGHYDMSKEKAAVDFAARCKTIGLRN